ncbi:MAG: acetylglutamate kinase [Tepidisphaera sp.]|nr:acetylglutamate kinase [Tepidisphaera sp.]
MTRPLVLKVGGTTLEDRAPGDALWRTIGALHAGHAGGVVLVHGGGKAVDKHLDRLGFVTQRREGIRVTPPEQLDEIVAVLAGRINKAVAGALCASGAKAVGLCLGDGMAVPTRLATKYSFDVGRVGEVVLNARTGGTPGLLQRPMAGTGGTPVPPTAPNLLSVLLANGFLPVVSSIGIDEAGGFLNINADDAAAGIAARLNAAALVLLTDVPGILDGAKRLVREVSPGAVGGQEGIEGLITRGEITGGMIVKARAAAEVATTSGVPVIITDASVASLEALAKGEATGTRIVA